MKSLEMPELQFVSKSARRRMITRIGTTLLVTTWLCLPVVAQPLDLRDQRRDGEAVRVKVTLDARGELTAEGAKKDEPLRANMAVKAQAIYVERLLSHENSKTTRAARIFESARAELVVGAEKEINALNATNQVIITELIDKRVRAWSPAESLSRRELDVVQAAHHSLSVDLLLPGKSVQPGEKWPADPDVLAALLQLDHVGINETSLQLMDVQKGMARIQITGTAKGRVDGVLTETEVTGDCRFDTRWKRVTWLQLKVHEKREQSATSPALDVQSELRMLIEPIPATHELVKVLPQQLPDPTPQTLLVRLDSQDAGIQALHSRDWLHVEERQRQITLRWADQEKAIAQLSLSRLKDGDKKSKVTLQEFESDIQKALGDKFGQIERSKEVDRGDGYRVLRVAVGGTVNDIPIRWIYYHVTSPEGYQVSLTFTMGADEERAAELEGHERQFLASLKLGPALDSKKPTPLAEPVKEQAQKVPAASGPNASTAPRNASRNPSDLLPRR